MRCIESLPREALAREFERAGAEREGIISLIN